MKVATDWWRSKTTWTAAGAVCFALADVAAKGQLTWQSALIALVGVLGATIRDTMAKAMEQSRVSDEIFGRTLEATSANARATTALTAALSARKSQPRQNPSLMSRVLNPTTTTEDGECDRIEGPR